VADTVYVGAVYVGAFEAVCGVTVVVCAVCAVCVIYRALRLIYKKKTEM